MGSGAALIEVRNLNKVYSGRTESVRALEDVSFSIGEREFVSIVGPSGCGKSTLLKSWPALFPGPRATCASDRATSTGMPCGSPEREIRARRRCTSPRPSTK